MSSSRLGGFLPDRWVAHCHAIAGPLSLIRWSAPKAEDFFWQLVIKPVGAGLGGQGFRSGPVTTRAAAVIRQMPKGRVRMGVEIMQNMVMSAVFYIMCGPIRPR